MVEVTGRSAVDAYFATLPAVFETKILPGAARAAGKVIADEAKLRVESSVVRDAIVTRSKREPGLVTVRVTVKKGWPASLGNWLEWGTAGHFISVDDSQREGRSVGRINKLQREGALRINGQFVGKTVWHPGARPHPFLRPALDSKEVEARAAAQSYITTRVARLRAGGRLDEGGEA